MNLCYAAKKIGKLPVPYCASRKHSMLLCFLRWAFFTCFTFHAVDTCYDRFTIQVLLFTKFIVASSEAES